MTKIGSEVTRLNQGIDELDGAEVSLEYHGRPSAHVLSLDPLHCETYNLINRGPHLMGAFAVRSLLTQISKNGHEEPVVAFEADDGKIYAGSVSACQMNQIGKALTSNPDYSRWVVCYDDDYMIVM